MGRTPVVSVVIPCYNARRWISETLESVQGQGMDGIEVIVVDDGSTDGTSDFIASQFPFVRIIRTSNGGPSRARNIGLTAASGEFIQYLDADDLLPPGKITRHVACLRESGADVVYGDWQKLHRVMGGQFVPGDVIIREIVGSPQCALLHEFWCPPHAYLYRRGIVDKVGGWNEKLLICQDGRFAFDCAFHGGEFVYCPGVAAYYRVHTDGSQSTRSRAALFRESLTNAQEVEELWQANGGLDRNRRKALIINYEFVARGSFEDDRPTFEIALGHLHYLQPGYRPSRPRHLAFAARVLGYRRAEALALVYRGTKRLWRGRG